MSTQVAAPVSGVAFTVIATSSVARISFSRDVSLPAAWRSGVFSVSEIVSSRVLVSSEIVVFSSEVTVFPSCWGVVVLIVSTTPVPVSFIRVSLSYAGVLKAYIPVSNSI